MKKHLIAFLITVTLTTLKVSAVTIPSPISGDFLSNFTKLTSYIPLILTVTTLGIFGWAGWTRMKAGDDKDEIKKAAQIAVGGVVGLVGILIAPSVVDFIGLIFGVDNLIDINS